MLATPITAVALGMWFEVLFGKIGGVIGVLSGISIWLGINWWFGNRASDLAIATVEEDKLVVIKQQTAEREGFLFSELAKYRVMTKFRGKVFLRLSATNGRQLALAGSASPEFTSLIKEFDMTALQYERFSGKRFTRI